MKEPASRKDARPGAVPLWRRLRLGSLGGADPSPPPDPLRTAGLLLREAREAKGLGLRQLAQRTRISIAVLEALEGGWRDRLPEATYLRAMLPLLEHQLDLAPGSLEPMLPHAAGRTRGGGGRVGQPTSRFSPFTLHFLRSWQSSLLYGLLLLGLLYGINLQQQRLAAMGRLAVNPIPLSGPHSRAPQEQDGPGDLFPELHPLNNAARGQAMDLLTADSRRGPAEQHLGLLTLSLGVPTDLDLRSRRSGDTRLTGIEGELSLPVLPPFELRLRPAPTGAAVRWRGQVLPPRESGVYGVPAASATGGTGAPPREP